MSMQRKRNKVELEPTSSLDEAQRTQRPEIAANDDQPLFDQSMEETDESDAESLETAGTGYLVVFTEGNVVQAMLYDNALQFVTEIDLHSAEADRLLDKAVEVTDPHDLIWDTVMEDISPHQRMESKVFRLSEEIPNERDAEIEDVMLENDDELPYGYSDEEDDNSRRWE